jgi:Ni,Fe-hydrogenase I large subunit
VITPRICGICTTGHLLAAVRALDMIAHVAPPPNALRIRNVTYMAEQLQSDVRHGFLMFAPDLANTAYQGQPLFAEAARRYQPFQGETVIKVIRETKRLIEVIAILGGQWPHSSFMVPGGATSIPSVADLLQYQLLLGQFRQFRIDNSSGLVRLRGSPPNG